MTVQEANDKLRSKYGEHIKVQIESYEEDDGSTWFRYFCGGRDGTEQYFETVEEAYRSANMYLS